MSARRSAERSLGVSRRSYDSPLRERQAQQTRDAILDSLTSLLADRGVDEVTTKELARAAGVSERTVYRHFPDRSSLVEGLSERMFDPDDESLTMPDRIEDLGRLVSDLYRLLESHRVAAQAEALLNADPRRYVSATRLHTEQFRALVDSGLPDLDAGRRRSIAALVRVLASPQAWLRIRAEFGVGGDESGPVVAWAIDALLAEIARGNPPPPS